MAIRNYNRPHYRTTQNYTINRLGMQVRDDETGEVFYERDKVVQYGLTKNSRNRGSVDVIYREDVGRGVAPLGLAYYSGAIPGQGDV